MSPTIPQFQPETPPLGRLPGRLIFLLLSIGFALLGSTPSKASSHFVEVLEGQLPVVLTAPHGGREKPDAFPDRPKGTFAFDTNTQELAKACAAALQKITGLPVDLVVCKLHRIKVDCNREAEEGAAGHPEALGVWNDYHAAIRSALQRSVQQHGMALLIDLHGHGHPTPRMEIGYGHNPDTYALPEPELNAQATWTKSTVAALMRRPSPAALSYAEVIRGPASLGSLLSRQGFAATPSESVPVPPAPYFNGGYTVRRFPSEIRGVAALQIETHYRGLRDQPENQKRFGEALAEALRDYLPRWLGVSLPMAR